MHKPRISPRLAAQERPRALRTLQSVAEGLKVYETVASGLRCGLFDWLETRGETPREEVAEGLRIHGSLCRSYLQVFCDLGLLVKEPGDRYRNSALASEALVSTSPLYQGTWFLQSGTEGSRWRSLDSTLRMEEPPRGAFADGPSEPFIQALAQRALQGELQGVVRAVTEWKGFAQTRELLDVGGGHGLYALALCQENRNLRATVLDKPHVIPFAEPYIAEAGLENRVQTRGGDAMEGELGGPYDLILVSHLLYKFRKELPAFLSRAAAALRPGGMLVSHHWFCRPGCTSSAPGIQDLEQCLQSFGHPLCHVETFLDLFREAGLEPLGEGVEIPGNLGPSLVHRACKPLGTPR